MKVKRFNNLWIMGLIIFGVILIAMYLMKAIFPEFVVKIAEVKPIVDFGNYVDTHKWAYYLFNSLTSIFGAYFLCCACCRIKKLNYKSVIVIISSIAFSYVLELILPEYVFYYNFMANIFMPVCIYKLENLHNEKVIYSTCICFVVNTVAQCLSLYIRDISTMISFPNTATYFILLIDAYIWTMLLYCFYNYKRRVKNNG